MSSDRERIYDPRGPPEQKRDADPIRNDPSVIKIRGLPYQTTAMEVCRFFKDCEIIGGPNGIYFPSNERGLPTGEAFVEMKSTWDIDKALGKHKDCIGGRYIEVFESRMSVLEKVKKICDEGGGLRSRESGRDREFRGERSFGGGGSRGFVRGPGKGVSRYCVKLRGLPWETRKVFRGWFVTNGELDDYDCQGDVADFLKRCEIVGGLAGIIINKDDRGRAAGDAYVELQSRDDVELALAMHKRDMGSRYIEVFEANRLDVEEAKSRLDKDLIGSKSYANRSRAFKVQLRGLPYKVTKNEISDWLCEAAEPVDIIIMMDRGRPSGRAECVFKSDREARRVAQYMHRRDLGHRYIECFYEGGD